jgi:hypothetical protein
MVKSKGGLSAASSPKTIPYYFFDLIAPVVSLTSDHAVVTTGDSVTYTAHATDAWNVAKIEVMVNRNLVKTCLAVSDCAYTLAQFHDVGEVFAMSARAFDGSGNESDLAIKEFQVQAPPDTTAPQVSFSSTMHGPVNDGSSLTFTANATDNVGVTSIVISRDRAAIKTCNNVQTCSITENYSHDSGIEFSYNAEVKDAAGNSVMSDPIVFTVQPFVGL